MIVNKDNLGKVINVGKNEYPIVNYRYQDIDGILKRFFCVKRNTDKVLGKVLSQFGFTKNDMITLTSIIYEDDNITFNYMVNGVEDKNNKIILEYADLIYKYRMMVSDKDRDITCKVTAFHHKNISFNVTKIEERLNNGIVYSREYNVYSSVYRVRVNDIELELCLKNKIKDSYSERMLILEKELELENYLKNISLPNSIDTLYKDIAKYLGDVSEYSNLSLKIRVTSKEIDGNSRLVDVVKVTDMISLRNGVCDEFKITRGNRCITLDRDGNSTSEYRDEFCDITTIQKDFDKATYSISASNDIVLREELFIHGVNEYEMALDEIDNTKKLVREMFPRKK